MDHSIYRLRLHQLLTLCVLGLLGLGCLMVQSASIRVGSVWRVEGVDAGGKPVSQVIETSNQNTAMEWARKRGITNAEATNVEGGFHWTDLGTNHAMYAGAALLAFLLVGRLDYQRLGSVRLTRNVAVWGFAVSCVLCLAVLVPGIGREVNGARRWIPLGPLQFQPSEVAKWASAVFLAVWLFRRPVDPGKFRGFLITMMPIAVVCGLIAIQDFGTAALIAVASLAIVMAAGGRLWHVAVFIPPLAAVGTWFILQKPYRVQRLTSFMEPFRDPQGEGYHMVQSILSFASGGIWGRGLGNGVQKLGYLPEDTTDFIFAVVCEELGIFGALFVVLMYAGILFVAWQVLRQKRDSFGRILGFGITAMITMQAMINMAVATVSVPTKGMSLPLVSAGGSGLIITCCAMGLLCSVARHRHEDELASEPLWVERPALA